MSRNEAKKLQQVHTSNVSIYIYQCWACSIFLILSLILRLILILSLISNSLSCIAVICYIPDRVCM